MTVPSTTLDAGRQIELLEFLLGELDQFLVTRIPQPVALVTEILHPDARCALVGQHRLGPGSEILDATDLDVRAVHVDPVVIEGIRVVRARA